MATYKIITRVDEGGRYWRAVDDRRVPVFGTHTYIGLDDCRKKLVAIITEMATEQEVEIVELP